MCRSRLCDNALRFPVSHTELRPPLRGILKKIALHVLGEGNAGCLSRMLNASSGRTSALFSQRDTHKIAENVITSEQFLFSTANLA